MENQDYHIPVLLNETIEGLNIVEDGVYVDCTFGGGGHSKHILSKLIEKGQLIAFDQDADAAKNVPADKRLTFVPHNFRHLQRFLKLYGHQQVNGLMADLGVSSHQFDEAERGFSYRFNALLDMRMDKRQPKTAATILNSYDAAKLQSIFSLFGEVTNSKTLAQAIVQYRLAKAFSTIQDLLDCLKPLVKGNPNRYYAQVFQALRIEVNEELEALKDLLIQLETIIKIGGRVAIITFHSLEDKLVKHFFKQGSFDVEEDHLYGTKKMLAFKMVTKKPIEASPEELKKNVRSRSAKLRVYERVD